MLGNMSKFLPKIKEAVKLGKIRDLRIRTLKILNV